jgi:hypothetical protein
MTDLERLTTAFEAMNLWARELLRELAEGYAVGFPEPEPSSPPPGTDIRKVTSKGELIRTGGRAP